MANSSSNQNGSGSGCLLFLVAIAAVAALMHFHILPVPWESKASPKSGEVSELYVPDSGSIETDAATNTSYVNNILLIFFKPGTSDSEKMEAVSSVDGEVVGRLDAIDQLQVQVKTSSLGELKEMCSSLQQLDSVTFASFDEASVVSADEIPNDPWGSDSGMALSWDSGHPEGTNWWVNATDAMLIWDDAESFDEITIGIIDNGFDTSHEDLRGKISLVSEHNSVEDHGTHVAGIIGAAHNNRIGISGIVPNCNLITTDWKLTEEQEAAMGGQWSTTNQILGQTVLLVQNGAKVINLSLGCTRAMEGTSWDYNGLGHLSSQYLLGLLERGYDFVLVQSAGNGNAFETSVDAANNGYYCSVTYENCAYSDRVSPGDIINRIIVVGAAELTSSGSYVQASWSNAGPRVDLCAPGVDIYSTVSGNGYALKSGTSMAAPIVAGTAALVWAANPSLTGADVKHHVCSNTYETVSAGYSELHPFYDEYPMVNTFYAVSKVMPQQTPKPEDLYASVLNAYRNSAGELSSNNSVTAAGSYRFYAGVDTGSPLAYAFHDIDGNGVPELLIGGPCYDADGSMQIVDAYGLNGDTPVCLFQPIKDDYEDPPGTVPMFHGGEIPRYLRIFADGSICARIGSSDDPACYVRSKIASDGHSLMTLQGLFANYTPMNPVSPDEPAYNYFAYSEDCANPSTDYDDFIIYCLNLYGAPFLESEPYGVQNDYDAWTIRYCSQYGAMITPSWNSF